MLQTVIKGFFYSIGVHFLLLITSGILFKFWSDELGAFCVIFFLLIVAIGIYVGFQAGCEHSIAFILSAAGTHSCLLGIEYWVFDWMSNKALWDILDLYGTTVFGGLKHFITIFTLGGILYAVFGIDLIRLMIMKIYKQQVKKRVSKHIDDMSN